MSNITTQVSKGETIDMYAKMYGTTTEAILNANKGLKEGQLKIGSKIVIPIGKPKVQAQKEESFKESKLNEFDNNVKNSKMELYNTNMTPKARELKEARYKALLAQQQERKETASITLSKDKSSYVLKMKKDISLTDLRKLFPELNSVSFSDYADETRQYSYENGHGFVKNPDKIIMKKGATIEMNIHKFNNKGAWQEFIHLFSD